MVSPVAAAEGQVAGWIPWWQDTKGLKSATKNIDHLDTVYPFAFEVTAQGELTDKAGLDDRQWRTFFRLARKEKVEIIPSVMWFDGAAIHAVLSNERSRRAHITAIVNMVEDGDYDGVNIDYEGKLPETIDYFSLFLKELNVALGKELLTCAIEARTPPEDLYSVLPNPLRYANDYKAIGEHCDRIELMTYDQQRADLTLNKTRQGLPYMPVADDAWVRKVVTLALRDFPREKVYLGIPTYGRAWDVEVAPDWYRNYTLAGTLNPPRFVELTKEYKVKTGRSVGGDAIISYIPKGSPWARVLAKERVPKNTPKGYEVAAQALSYATRTGTTVSVRFGSYSDAVSAKRRLTIADEYRLAGVAFFKIDGEEDQAIWKLFK